VFVAGCAFAGDEVWGAWVGMGLGHTFGAMKGTSMLCGPWPGGCAWCRWEMQTGEGRGAWGARGQAGDIGTTQLSLLCSSQRKGGFNPSR